MEDNTNAIFAALKSEIQKYGMSPPETSKIGDITIFSDNGKRNDNGWSFLKIFPNGSAYA